MVPVNAAWRIRIYRETRSRLKFVRANPKLAPTIAALELKKAGVCLAAILNTAFGRAPPIPPTTYFGGTKPLGRPLAASMTHSSAKLAGGASISAADAVICVIRFPKADQGDFTHPALAVANLAF
jgi:hypothetical protein